MPRIGIDDEKGTLCNVALHVFVCSCQHTCAQVDEEVKMKLSGIETTAQAAVTAAAEVEVVKKRLQEVEIGASEMNAKALEAAAAAQHAKVCLAWLFFSSQAVQTSDAPEGTNTPVHRICFHICTHRWTWKRLPRLPLLLHTGTCAPSQHANKRASASAPARTHARTHARAVEIGSPQGDGGSVDGSSV